jgi:hypothetical protein
MGIASMLSVFVSKKHEKPWEVVDSKAVEPVPLYEEEDGTCESVQSLFSCILYLFPLFIADSEMDIIYVHEARVVRTYVFDVRKDKDVENSVLFAQQQFLEEIQRKGYNAFWTEGCVPHVFMRPCFPAHLVCYSWRLTLLRKAKRHRVEVKYIGQPACLNGKSDEPHQPPFLAVLEELRPSLASPA